MSAKQRQRAVNKAVVLRVLRSLRRYWVFLALSLVLAAVSVGTQLLVPVLTGNAIDEMLGAGQVNFSCWRF